MLRLPLNLRQKAEAVGESSFVSERSDSLKRPGGTRRISGSFIRQKENLLLRVVWIIDAQGFFFSFTRKLMSLILLLSPLSCKNLRSEHQPGCRGWTSCWWTTTTPPSLRRTTAPSCASPRPPLPRRRPPRRRGARATSTSTCGSSSACWCSCWRCSSSPSTGWRTSSPPRPRSPTAAARGAAPSPTWRSAASRLRGPPCPRCPPEAGGHRGGGGGMCEGERETLHGITLILKMWCLEGWERLCGRFQQLQTNEPEWLLPFFPQHSFLALYLSHSL